LVESVEENKLLYTDWQIQRAKLARSIYHAMGTPSLKDFKSIITSNMVKNIPITIDDINNVEKVFGLDVGALKGKTTQQKPAPDIRLCRDPKRTSSKPSKCCIMYGWNGN
jgi:hypothetical protein